MTRFSRLFLLALGVLTMGGASALAAPEAPKGSKEVAEARLKLAEDALKAVREHLGRTMLSPGERDPLFIWSRRRMEARQDLSTKKADRVAAAREHLDEMKGVERLVMQIHETGQIDSLTVMDAQYRRLEAESWLAREQEKEED